MATLREIRRRIVGVKSTQKITKAMKMVAAAKLRRAQSGVLAARPYASKMSELLSYLATSPDMAVHPLVAPRPVKNVAIVIVTSDRGLCGAFNSNLLKTTLHRITQQYADLQQQGNLTVFCVGKKGFDVFSKKHFRIAGKYIGVYANLVFAQAQAITREIVDGYVRGEYDKVEIVYNEFRSVAQQRISVDQLLPIPAASGETKKPVTTDYIFEPSQGEIIQSLLPKHLQFQVWRVLLESNASEQGARMAAMENATVNATEMISTLQLQYNKARQATITKELLEIVSGAEALKKAG